MLITMTVFAAFVALASAMAFGYYCGRRAASVPPTWKKRTSRVALGRRAIDLLVLVAARRVRRRLGPDPVVALFALRVLAPLDLLRGSMIAITSR